MDRKDIQLHSVVRAFDPRTLGVVKYGHVNKIGRKYVTLDFGLTGTCKVRFVDVIETV